MARLNDVVPPPVESIEAVKRRYLRQNRELARCNSMQSQRIRILESEVSRLLTMNAELSQENIALRVELDTRPTIDGVQSVKQKLESQMQLLGGLVAELSAMQQISRDDERPKTAVKPYRDQLDIMEDEARHLPAIREEHPWPVSSNQNRRRSSGGARVTFDLSPTVAEAPQEESASMPDAVESTISAVDIPGGDATALPSTLSINLETRRRRRDSGRRTTLVAESSDSTAAATTSEDDAKRSADSRHGLKRKLDVRDDATDARSKTMDLSKERVGDKIAVRRDAPSATKSILRDKKEPKQALKSAVSQQRRAFGEKPVNTDPVVSPRKPKRTLALEKPQKVPSVGISTEQKLNLPLVEILSQDALARDDQTIPDANTDAVPKTPASCDIFSPLSQISTERPVAKDTPPPANLGFGTMSTGAEQAGRVARRARAVVNYAEPSLISKMRRPTKEMVDAVGKDGRPIPGSIVSKTVDKSTEQWQPKRVSLQNDQSANVQEDIASPLVNRAVNQTETDTEMVDAMPLIHKTNHRTSLSADLPTKQRAMINKDVGLASAVQDSEKRRRKIDEIKEAEMAVYEFKDSSPMSQSSEEARPRKTAASSSHRRHSSMMDVRTKLENVRPSDSLATRTEDVLARSSRSVARRRSMMI